jgi:hypothetical protein
MPCRIISVWNLFVTTNRKPPNSLPEILPSKKKLPNQPNAKEQNPMKNSLRLGFCAAIASLALASTGWALELDTGGSLGTNGWTLNSSHMHLTEDAGTSTNSLGGKLINLQGITGQQGTLCLEFVTTPGFTTTNPDTRLFVNDHGTQRSINDDFGGTLQSKGRLFINRTSSSSLDWVGYVGAYSSGHNSEDFNIQVTRLDISEAACTTGQNTIPWAKIVGSDASNTVTLSPNAT